MRANLEHYRIFYNVAKRGSFTAAANAMMTSQPALSRSVKVLEENLGCMLFTRTSRGVKLTPEGEQLMVFVSKAYEELVKAEELMGRLNEFSEGFIKISAGATPLLTYLLDRMAAFREAYPDVKLNVLNNNSETSIQMLENGEVDFAVVSTPFVLPHDVKGVMLKTFRDVLVCGEKFAHLKGKPLSISELAKYPLVAVIEGTAIRTFYDRVFLNSRCVFSPEVEVATVELLLPMIRRNLGIGFVPEVYYENGRGDGYLSLEVKEEIPSREIWLLYREDDTLSLAAKMFRDFV